MNDYGAMVQQLLMASGMQPQQVADTGSPIKEKMSRYGLTEGARGYSGGYGTAVPSARTIKSLQRRVQTADSDEELARVVRDAGRYGVDWSYMLNR
jgi:hypothetical protein